jgi:hypothetical protein
MRRWNSQPHLEEAHVKHTKRWIAGTAVAVATLGVGAGVAAASGGDDHAPAIQGAALDRARGAALAHTGGGTVSGSEVGDEESYYEVEVTLKDGRQVDVQLDRAFHVVGSKTDHEKDE